MGKTKKVNKPVESKELAELKEIQKQDPAGIAKIMRETASKNLVGKPFIITANVLQKLYEPTVIDKELDIKGIDFNEAGVQLKLMTDAVKNGDLSALESLLISQANLLHHWFCRYITLAFTGTNMEVVLARYYLALKMQEQCRKSIATIGALKMPRQTAFIKQQNVAQNQQVIEQMQITNNTAPPPVSENFSTNEANELLGGDILAKRMDTRALSKAIGANTEMEALGAVQRPYNTNWETKIS
jgi:hypothetical protein